jgi:hypothetical protein
MVVSLHVDIIAPDDELAVVNECYCMIVKEAPLPFAPFEGLLIGLSPTVPRGESKEFEKLWRRVYDKTGLFTIHQVIYWDHDERTQVSARIWAPTLSSFYATQEFYIRYYGFELF